MTAKQGKLHDKIDADPRGQGAEEADIETAVPSPRTYRFGEFELDLEAQQLRKDKVPVRLERRPFDLLVMLVRSHGRLVSREEIIASLWPGNVIIDFDSGLNTLVRKVRHALGDVPDSPRYVETVPGRGYRFIAPLREPLEAVAVAPAAATQSRRWVRPAAVLTLAILVMAGGYIGWLSSDDEPEETRIAILPFENLTGDEQFGYLASGIAEDTNTSLGQVDLPNLRVIGIVSALALADSGLPPGTIGERLGVDYVVASSLRLEQTRMRVSSRLVRVRDGEQVWSAAFDRELTNLLGLQRELSVAIAEQIRQRLSPDVAAAIDARQTRNPVAYELYLKGRYEWSRFQPDSVPRALEFYRQAVERDPGYALAWAGIARALVTSVVTVEADPLSTVSPARDALQNALEYGPDLAETQLALGSFHFFLDRDLPAAEAAARKAVALDPNSAMSHMFLGIVLAERMQHVEARAMLRRARELDPFFPLTFANSAVVALMAGEFQEALEFATQAVAINPEFWVGHLHLGTAKLGMNDFEGAIRAYAAAERYSGNSSARASSGRARALAAMGRIDEAREILGDLMSRSAGRNVPAYYVAVVHAALGDIDEAFAWLELSIGESSLVCGDIERSEGLENLRSDRRFEALLQRCRIRHAGAADVTEHGDRISRVSRLVDLG